LPKRVWILLRGLVRESGHWGGFIKKLKARDPHALVLPLDWPGLGVFHEQDMPLDPLECVDFLEQQLGLALGDKAVRLSIIGLSLGGALALYWCQKQPHLFERVVVINGSLANLSAPWLRLRGLALARIIALLFEPSLKTREQKILLLTSALCRENPKHIVDAWANLAAHHRVRFPTFLRQMILASRIRVTTPITPTPLFLASRKDAVVNWRSSRAMSRFFSAPLVLHEHAGHDLPLDDPDWCLDHILRRDSNF